MSLLRTALIIAALIYLALLVGDLSAAAPSPLSSEPQPASPDEVGLSGVEVVNLATQPGEKLVAWYAPRARRQADHSLLSRQCRRHQRPRRSLRLLSTAPAIGVMFLSYRGYGESTGSPSEAGLISDANAAYDWLIRHKRSRIERSCSSANRWAPASPFSSPRVARSRRSRLKRRSPPRPMSRD